MPINEPMTQATQRVALGKDLQIKHSSRVAQIFSVSSENLYVHFYTCYE